MESDSEEIYANFERRSDEESVESEKKHNLEIFDEPTSESEASEEESYDFSGATLVGDGEYAQV